MLIAMDSSCMVGLVVQSSCIRIGIVKLAKCRQRGLTEADATIVGRDVLVGPDIDESGVQTRLQVAQQQLVLECSAAEHDCVQAVRLADRKGSVMQALGHAKL